MQTAHGDRPDRGRDHRFQLCQRFQGNSATEPMGILHSAKLFPVILLACNASAAVCCAAAGDFR